MPTARIFFLFLIFPAIGFAQLQVDLSESPEEIVQNHLLGDGVVQQNITFNGVDGASINSQIGIFSSGLESIGISNGIVLATGHATVAEGPNDLPTAFEAIDEDDEFTNDADLEELVGGIEGIHDAAVLEFDFLASGDTLRFSYVFASEEYNEHTCSPYNDAFGFFISGPGIDGDGTFTNNAINLATVPGRDVPVAINTVNQGFAGEYGSLAVCNGADINWQENSQYFIDNEFNTSINTTQFDGLTTVFTVEIPVECGGLYHIKLGIADAVDGKNDSAVFIKSKSFSSKAHLEVDYEISNPINGMAAEGCSSYDFRLTRNDSASVKTVYLRSAFADAHPNIFPGFPDSLVFYPAQGYLDWELPIQHDGQFDGDRILDIEFLQPNICGLDTVNLNFDLEITDTPPFEVNYQDTLAVTCDQNGLVDITINGGIEPYEIEWDGDQTGFNFELSGVEPLVLAATVSDQCGFNQENISIEYLPIVYEPLEVIIPENMAINCLEPLVVNPVVSGGRGDYSFQWQFGTGIVSNEQVLELPDPQEGTVSVLVEDGCAQPHAASIQVVLMDNPVFVEIGDDREGFCYDELVIVPEVSGGFGSHSFKWKRNLAFQSSSGTFSFTPQSNSVVTLEVEDECEQKAFDTLTVYVDTPPITIELVSDTMICSGDRLDIAPTVSGGVGDYAFWWPERGSDAVSLSIVPERDETYTLQVTDDCLTSAEAEINIGLVAIKADFEFDYENDFSPLVNRSTGAVSYFWALPLGQTSTLFEPSFVPVLGEDQMVSLEITHALGCSDSKIGFYEPPLNLFIPNAFTPDGDGLNDVFSAKGSFMAEFEMWVYDRWGNVVFHTTNQNQGWNGGNIDGGFATENSVYSYRVIAKGYNNQVIDKKGSINVLR